MLIPGDFQLVLICRASERDSEHFSAAGNLEKAKSGVGGMDDAPLIASLMNRYKEIRIALRDEPDVRVPQ